MFLCFTCIESQGGAQPGQGGEFAPQPPAWPQFNPYEQSAIMYGMHPQMQQQQPNYNMNWQPPPYYGPPPGYFAPAFGPSYPPHEGMFPPPGHPASYMPVDQFPSWHSNTSSAGSSGSAASSYSRRGSGSSRSPRRSRRASEKKQGRSASSESRFDASMTLHQIKGECRQNWRLPHCNRVCDLNYPLVVSVSLRTRGQRCERPRWV